MSVSTGWGGAWCAYGQMSKEHDREFYEEARQRRDAAIARGEDPYADFREMIEKRGSDARLERAWRRVMDDQEAQDDAHRGSASAGEKRHRLDEKRNSPAEKNDESSMGRSDSRKGAFRRLFIRRKH